MLKIVDLVDKLSDQWHPTIDFWVILGMKWKLDTNSFSTTNDALGGRKIYGMARFYSFLNHSCDPNADWRVKEIPLRGQRQRFEIEVTVGLNQTITPSDGILISYLPPADLQLSVAERRRKLESWFGTGVQCQCRKCIADSAALLAAQILHLQGHDLQGNHHQKARVRLGIHLEAHGPKHHQHKVRNGDDSLHQRVLHTVRERVRSRQRRRRRSQHGNNLEFLILTWADKRRLLGWASQTSEVASWSCNCCDQSCSPVHLSVF